MRPISSARPAEVRTGRSSDRMADTGRDRAGTSAASPDGHRFALLQIDRSMRRRLRLGQAWSHLTALVLFGLLRAAADTSQPVPTGAELEFFESRIRPVLIERCYECHSLVEKKSKGGLRLDTREGWVIGGDSGTALVPGNPDGSLLIKAIRYSDADLQMPPKKTGGPLTRQQIADFEDWVKGGAPDPRRSGAAQGLRINPSVTNGPASSPVAWWSFRPISSIPGPSGGGTNLAGHSLDRFVSAKLAEKGLKAGPMADRRTLARRAYFDLLGLPPTVEQVEQFVNDSTPDAWSKLIDHLLESKHYGERWGRHWLDVVRYADSGGYETDIYYRNAWRYRDYVVKSFNDDKPYDRFVQEQIAGDELWPNDLALDGTYKLEPEKEKAFEARTGTGFYTLGTQIHESNMDTPKRHYEVLTDWVDTTASAFLGLTFQCARCHDHKFDPFTQRDWYALAAAFAGSKEVEVPIIPGMGIADFRQHYPRLIAADEARRAYRLFEQRAKGRDLSDAEKKEKQQLLESIANAILALPQSDAQGIPFDGLMEVPTVSVLGHERPELVPLIRLLNRGELKRPRELVSADLPAVLRTVTDYRDPLPGPFGSRKRLALWITASNHPLTARVLVNRVWHWHFGRGIVGTPNDFGRMGDAPTHPDLLDWLAAKFIEGGWSLKKLHRLVMNSAVYQAASHWQNEENSRIDPENHYLWKANRRRLEAEILWDNLHAVAGTLNLKLGGRPVVPPLDKDEQPPGYWTVSADPSEHVRRGLYVLVRRNFRFPMFDVFDAPVNALSAPTRDVTTVAPQALWLLNNRTALRQARHFAGRLVKDSAPNEGWNKPDFGPGQTGWIGKKAGPHAGWAKRIPNGNSTPGLDDPIGAVITHGHSSVVWKVPASDPAGVATLRGGLWNLRRLGRSGTWKLWKNDRELLAEGAISDASGTSVAPLSLASARGKSTGTDHSIIGIPYGPGDTFRLEILENDFVGVLLTVTTQTRIADLMADFSLASNPTDSGWQYSESLANGGGAAGAAQLPASPVEPSLAGLVERAWKLALARRPTLDELSESIALIESLEKRGDKLVARPEALQGVSAERAAALSKFCLSLLNLHEFSFVD